MINTFDTLYSSDTKGAKLFWWMQVEDDKFRSLSKRGEKGKLTTTKWTTCKSKNVGRSNETTPQEQAVKEVKARYTKKLKSHFHLKEEDYQEKHFIEPMLAHKYPERKDKVWEENDRVLVQPKLDGFRCIISKEGAFSREGEVFVSVPHITKALEPLFEHCPSLILDGELYNHDLKDNFEELSSIIRKEKVTQEDLDRSEASIQFHCYDIISVPDEGYFDRYRSIVLLNQRYPCPYLKVVPFLEADSHEEVREHLETYLQEGYEGAIVRLEDSLYETFKRSNGLLKYKLFVDEEFTVVAIQEGKGNWTGYAKKVVVELEDGTHCEAGIKGKFAFTKKLFSDRDKYVGTKVTIKYFGRTLDNKLRHGVAVKYHAKV